jgi:hypothetical protein
MRSEEQYLIEINNIDNELRRINEHAKSLRAQKAKTMNGLHQYMLSNNLEQVSYGKKTFSIKKCEPKTRTKSKPKKQKKADTIQMFRDVGIPNPGQFYEELESIQKVQSTDDNTPKPSRKKGKKNEVDPYLGF